MSITTFKEKLKPILKERGLTMEELSDKIGMSRNNLYIATRQSIVSSQLLDKIADELQVDKSFFDEYRHPSVLQMQTANQNEQSTVSQNIGVEKEDIKALYERLLSEKDEQIKFLKEMVEFLKRQP